MSNKIDPSRDIDFPTIEWTPQPWKDRAACKQLPIGLFFVQMPGDDVTFARKVCKECPVRRECLTWACEQVIPYGIFGGLSPRERRNFRKGITNWEVCGTSAGAAAHDDKQEALCPACVSVRARTNNVTQAQKTFRQRQKDNRAQT